MTRRTFDAATDDEEGWERMQPACGPWTPQRRADERLRAGSSRRPHPAAALLVVRRGVQSPGRLDFGRRAADAEPVMPCAFNQLALLSGLLLTGAGEAG
jgi:hypothetical protein